MDATFKPADYVRKKIIEVESVAGAERWDVLNAMALLALQEFCPIRCTFRSKVYLVNPADMIKCVQSAPLAEDEAPC